MPSLTIAEWLDAEAQVGRNDPQPEGYITVTQYTEMRGIKRGWASEILRRLHLRGLADKKIWKRDGKLLTIYRLKK